MQVEESHGIGQGGQSFGCQRRYYASLDSGDRKPPLPNDFNRKTDSTGTTDRTCWAKRETQFGKDQIRRTSLASFSCEKHLKKSTSNQTRYQKI